MQSYSNQILIWLDTEESVDQNLLLASFYAAEIWPFVPNLSTYEDLLSTGNIRLLNDIDLRMGLSAYYNKADTSRSGWNPSEEYREIIRGIIPNWAKSITKKSPHCLRLSGKSGIFAAR